MDDLTLRPLRIGEVLDVAIKLYRANFLTLVKAVVIVVAPTQILSTLITSSSRSFDSTFTDFGGPGFEPGTSPEFDGGDAVAFIATALTVGVIGIITAQLASAASLRALSGAYLGENVDWRASLAFAYHRLGSLLWLGFLHTVLLGIGFVLCIVPGVYLYGALSVAVPVLLVENLRGTAALRRSRDLVRGRWWPVATVLVLSGILASIIQGALSGLVVGVTFSPANEIVADIVGTIAAIAAALITTPFVAAVSVVLYVDLRVRKEGFDLELLARGVGVDPADQQARPAFLPAGSSALPGSDTDDDDQPPFWPPPPGWRPRSQQ